MEEVLGCGVGLGATVSSFLPECGIASMKAAAEKDKDLLARART